MSYAVPRQWSHSDQPAAVDMQKYSDDLTFLAASIGNAARNLAVPYSLAEDTQTYWLVHAQHYLLFVSSGKIIDPAGVGDEVSLSTEETIGSYDLDTIPWLVYGKLYQVIGCSCCFEDGTGA